MKTIMSKVNSNLKSILDVLEKDIKKLEKTMNGTKNTTKQVQLKKNLILRKALYRYYKDTFTDIINNAEKELSNYISIVDDTATAERVFDLKNELVNIQELLSDVTDENVKDDIMDTFSQFAGSVVGERFTGSEMTDISPSSRISENPTNINKDEEDENDYYGSSIGETPSEKVEMTMTDEEGNELHGSDIEESHGSDVAGELVEEDEDEESHGSNVAGELVEEDEDEESHGSNVAGELVEEDEDEESHGSNVAGELIDEDEDNELHGSDVEETHGSDIEEGHSSNVEEGYSSNVEGKATKEKEYKYHSSNIEEIIHGSDIEETHGSNVEEDEKNKLFPGSTVAGKKVASEVPGELTASLVEGELNASNVEGKKNASRVPEGKID